MDDKMTFTVTAYGKTITITQPEDLDIHEFLNTCRTLAIALEYHEESWEDAIIAAADAIEANDVLPIKSKKDMWLHSDGQMRDYPDVDNITLPSDC